MPATPANSYLTQLFETAACSMFIIQQRYFSKETYMLIRVYQTVASISIILQRSYSALAQIVVLPDEL